MDVIFLGAGHAEDSAVGLRSKNLIPLQTAH